MKELIANFFLTLILCGILIVEVIYLYSFAARRVETHINTGMFRTPRGAFNAVGDVVTLFALNLMILVFLDVLFICANYHLFPFLFL